MIIQNRLESAPRDNNQKICSISPVLDIFIMLIINPLAIIIKLVMPIIAIMRMIIKLMMRMITLVEDNDKGEEGNFS